MVKGLLATIAAGALALAVPAAAQQAGPSCDLHEVPAVVPPGAPVVVTAGPRLTLKDIKPGAVVRGPNDPSPPERLAPARVTLVPAP